MSRVGQNHTYVRNYSVYTVFFSREIPVYRVIYGVHIHIQIEPTLHMTLRTDFVGGQGTPHIKNFGPYL